MCQNVILRLLKAVDFVVDVVNVVVVNIVVVALLVVTGPFIFIWGFEFLWWGSVVGCLGLHSHFCVPPKYSVEVVLWLSCVVVGVVTIFEILKQNRKRTNFPCDHLW